MKGGTGNVTYGWAHHFLLLADAYILSFACLQRTCCPQVKALSAELVFISSSKRILKLKPKVSTERLKRVLSAFNSVHGAVIRRLFAFDGKVIWAEHAE